MFSFISLLTASVSIGPIVFILSGKMCFHALLFPCLPFRLNFHGFLSFASRARKCFPTLAFSLLSSQSGKARFDSFYEMLLNPPTILKGGTISEFIMVGFSVLL